MNKPIKNSKRSLGLGEIKELLKLHRKIAVAKGVSKNDLNTGSIYLEKNCSPELIRRLSSDYEAQEDAEIAESSNAAIELIEKHIPDGHKLKGIQILEVQGSVGSHSDEDFCANFFTSCTLFLLTEKKLFKGVDIPGVELFRNDREWITLQIGSVENFDPRKTHALLSSSQCKILCAWTKR